jgi:nitrogen regulatory protein P-II 1
MKRIEAIIRPEKLDILRMELDKASYPGMMVTEIKGHGKQRGVTQQWRGTQYKVEFLPKIKVEIVAPDKSVKKLVAAIIEACHTGSVGDGKIFVSDVKDAIRIRTNEKGDKAVN